MIMIKDHNDDDNLPNSGGHHGRHGDHDYDHILWIIMTMTKMILFHYILFRSLL